MSSSSQQTDSQVIQCPLCGSFCPNMKMYVSHLRLVHQEDPSFFITCTAGDCTKTFRSFPAFNTHMYRSHRSLLGLKPKYEIDHHESGEVSLSAVSEDIDDNDERLDATDVVELTVDTAMDKDATQLEQAKFLLMLREEKKVSQVAIDAIVGHCRSLCKRSHNDFVKRVKILLPHTSATPDDISRICDELDCPPPDFFDGVDTGYLLESFAKKHMNYIEPKEILLGEPYYSQTKFGAKRRKVQAQKKFYYVPLLETLEKLLTYCDDYISEVENSHQSRTPLISDFCDASTFLEHDLFSSNPKALQIIAYYDELEVVNPIGTYVKKHKLGCLFFTLGNIRPRYRSVLKAINLVGVVKHEDLRDESTGIDCFLAPFVSDLKKLYCEGITVTINGKSQTFFGGLLAFLADNLAAHALGGFKESMSFALRVCRSCFCTRSMTQTRFMESSCTLRTSENHFDICQLLAGPLKSHYSTVYGVNRCSILEEVPGFSVINGLNHDIMHDLFEGVAQYEVKLLLQHCISSRYFSSNLLNVRIERYDFPQDKPNTIEERLLNSGDRKIRQSASQMMSLLFELPFIIGDKVPEDDSHWKAFLILLRICQIAISPNIFPDTTEYLRHLIEEKLDCFVILYPNQTIIPKQHYMVHYPSQILRSGPLIHSWTMRHEAKLSFIKRASRRGNFKNVCLTAAKKHQLWQCQKLHCDHFLHCDMEKSPKSTASSYNEEEDCIQEILRKLFPEELTDITVHHHSWIKVQSSKYMKGVYVLLKYDLINPIFGKVKDVIVVNGTVILSLIKYNSSFFDVHYNAFKVNPLNEQLAVEQHTLDFFNVIHHNETFISFDTSCYLKLPYIM